MKFTIATVALFIAAAIAAPATNGKRQTTPNGPNELQPAMTGPDGTPIPYDAGNMPGKGGNAPAPGQAQ